MAGFNAPEGPSGVVPRSRMKKGYLGPLGLYCIQLYFQWYPGACRDWTWRMKVGNGIASFRYTLWVLTGGR